jgi:hypothetical protein
MTTYATAFAATTAASDTATVTAAERTEDCIMGNMNNDETCATENCKNLTEFYICDDCLDEMMSSYERRLERAYYGD